MYYDKYDDNDLLRSILFFWNVFPRETPDGSWKVQNFVCGGQIELNQMGRNYFVSRKTCEPQCHHVLFRDFICYHHHNENQHGH